MMQDQNACAQCPAGTNENLVRLGIDTSGYDYLLALAGNPNTGKSTVFNNLTGLRQHTGNWPGKTVSRAEGAFAFNNKQYKIVDLPGTYSLLSTSADEEVARDFLLFGEPAATIIVVDATRIESSLNLVLQVLEITDRAVLCLNLIDEAKRHKITIDERTLSKELGIPVIPAAARQRVGMPELLQAIDDVITDKFICKPRRINYTNTRVQGALQELSESILKLYPRLPNVRWVAMRLLEGDQRMMDALRNGELTKMIKDDPVTQ